MSEHRRLRFVAPLRPRRPDHELEGEIAFLPMEAIGEHGAYDRGQTRPAEEIRDQGYTWFCDGDVIRARVTPCFENGKGALLTGLVGGEGLGTTELFVFRPGPDINPRFLFYVTHSTEFVQQGAGTMYGAHGVKRVDDAFARDYRVCLPPLAEQRAIADYLDRETERIDILIAAKERMALLLDERWRSLRAHSILRGCDPVSGAEGTPDGWDVRNLSATVTLQRGHDLPADHRVAGPVPVVSSGGVTGTHDQAACEPPGVVTGRYGTIGSTYFIDVPYWPLNTTLYVSDFRSNDPRWVYHMLAAMPLAIDEEKSAVTGINRNVVGMLRVPVPPLEEQRRIAGALDAAADRRELVKGPLRRQVELLREHRQALITATVTGQLLLPVAA